ncbi:DJ-1/PfpI family protein [Pandoraea pulmonicola]|uniref:Transcriptional activator FtrA n=1 Tax=Pandoraea pulmonicola TaxID=93221 RepID=A0AAJ4ZA00_PANPU|nr:DJ-1/PfpI family protein [Pandoraea pulmonicola]SUA89371.1 transcriptional activator FtrA [Pandoraea pulmonicola]
MMHVTIPADNSPACNTVHITHRFGISAAIVAATLACGGSPASGWASDAGHIESEASSVLRVPPPKAGRARATVAILADNKGTETTDFIVPYGVLKASGAVDVVTVSTEPGVVELMPALRVVADMSTEGFDSAQPQGADVVIVPAMHDDENPAVVTWIRAQASKGALIVSICEGAAVVANTGLLDARTATSHWYALRKLERQHARTRWIKDRRYVQDGNVVTTSGVTASLPASLALLQGMAGADVAKATAQRLGVATWSAEHDSTPFKLTSQHVFTAARNWLPFWRNEIIDIPVTSGFDEIALALTADAWSRTYRSKAVASSTDTVKSLRGLTLVPTRETDAAAHVVRLRNPAAAALDIALRDIDSRYGRATSHFVALQLEYPLPSLAQ